MRGEKKQPSYAKSWTQVKDWSWAYKKYTLEINSEIESIKSIDINPTGLIADTDNSNDIIRPRPGSTAIDSSLLIPIRGHDSGVKRSDSECSRSNHH